MYEGVSHIHIVVLKADFLKFPDVNKKKNSHKK